MYNSDMMNVCSDEGNSLEELLSLSGNKRLFSIEEERLVAIETAEEIKPGKTISKIITTRI